MSIIKVPQLAWYEAKELELPLPDGWPMEMAYMAGYNRRALEPSEIKAGIKSPIVGKPIRELARGKRDVVIIFDDQTRVTRAAKIVPYVLEELAEAGIPEKNIQFICGLGLHGVMYRPDMVKKLGADVVARFRVFNHNPFESCVYVGTTKTLRTRVYVNEEYMKCDLKIAIGSCVPHPGAGFGGGGKLILPGVTSFESIYWNHTRSGMMGAMSATPGAKPTMGMGIIDGNVFKIDIDECADLAGIDFLVNPIVNLWGEAVQMFAGSDFRRVHSEAVKVAKVHYATPKMTDKDLVIANAYAKVNEASIALSAAFPMLKAGGGDIVLISNAPEGQIPHYLGGLWGKSTGAVSYSRLKIPANVNRVLVYSEYPHPGSSWFEEDPKIAYFAKWGDILEELNKAHGAGTKVGVIPDGTNQYFSWYG